MADRADVLQYFQTKDEQEEESYVVVGATIRCSGCGGGTQKLELPVSHGVCVKDKPQMNIQDYKVGENIKPFKFCTSSSNPKVQAAELRPVTCTPVIEKPWINGRDDKEVEGSPALSIKSTVICSNGGTISIENDGQELSLEDLLNEAYNFGEGFVQQVFQNGKSMYDSGKAICENPVGAIIGVGYIANEYGAIRAAREAWTTITNPAESYRQYQNAVQEFWRDVDKEALEIQERIEKDGISKTLGAVTGDVATSYVTRVVGKALKVCAGEGLKFNNGNSKPGDKKNSHSDNDKKKQENTEGKGKPNGGTGNTHTKVKSDGEQYTRQGRNKVLKPNVEYTTEAGHTYKTDSNGRIISCEGKLKLEESKRNNHAQKVAGRNDRLADDDGGHLIATRFKGSGGLDNMVPMNSNLNRGEWKKLENKWAQALDQKKSVEVKITPRYQGNSQRPVSFDIKYKIGDGKWKLKEFKNKPGGI
ncbi:DNA/RNA non-specific endonuclease [Aneurinibacillus uraniidurans]|uniref:DNA/RNA non-specific endonuclease n=1 Tax=Aneurinibacillus uraniidurans TaxID=2966586 RepID=UPI0023492B15|nr:DNA/RNA non-specific endonuclease [Aneurinibacillus sp. B1]WCN36415.1 DNA/RNA non-specific endonuclease [Aneurinibacillus sp. B1]